jgi:hypothetical protein
MAWKYSSPSGTNPARQIPRPGTAEIYTTLATTQSTPTRPGIPTTKVGAYERPEQPPKSWSSLVTIGAVAFIAALCWLLGLVA